MKEYILKEDALNFEMEVEAEYENIQSIVDGMSIYGEYLKELPSVKINDWVSVNEKMPEFYEHVLVVANYDGYLVYDIDSYHPAFKEFLINKKNVTHWMKLPEFPKMIKKEN